MEKSVVMNNMQLATVIVDVLGIILVLVGALIKLRPQVSWRRSLILDRMGALNNSSDNDDYGHEKTHAENGLLNFFQKNLPLFIFFQ